MVSPVASVRVFGRFAGRLTALVAVLVGATVAIVPTASTPSAAADATTDTAATYTDAVFGLFLGRAPAEDEARRWRPTVVWGPLSSLTGHLARSTEWTRAAVTALYPAILDRDADPEGVEFWTSRVRSGWSIEDVAADLYGSDEYFVLHGGDDWGFVDSLYELVLGRAPERDGRRYWVGTIRSGTLRSTVASGFLGAIESRRLRVDRTFRAVLGRAVDPQGNGYWAEQIVQLGDVGLAAHLAASDEYHRRATGVARPVVARGLAAGGREYADAGGVRLFHPAAWVERVGFHESTHDGAVQAAVLDDAVRPVVLDTRYRETGSHTAADLVVPPDAPILTPVSGRVVRAGTYVLYCRFQDAFVVIEPDAHPGWEVVVLHVSGLQVGAGERVEAGVTAIAAHANRLPFASQVDEWTAVPAWPHVHVEVRDPAVPDRPSGSC